MSARDYGKIHSSFWTSGTIRDMSEDGRTLAAYLLTSPHTNMLGCFRLPLAYACDDLKWPQDRLEQAFNNVSENGFAIIDPSTSWIVVLKFLKWNGFENPNVGKAAAKIFVQIPDTCLAKRVLADRLREFGKHFPGDLLAPFETVNETVSKPFANRSENPIETVQVGFQQPFRNPEPNQNQNQNQNLTPLSGTPDDADIEVDEDDEREPELQIDESDPVAEAIGYLNDRAGTKFRVVEASAKLIRARMREGATIAQLKAVIDTKDREWPKGNKMRKYLRPATLFNAEKFEQYVGQLGAAANTPDSQEPVDESLRRLAW
jgi:uncharacterized phage protein (TIGR02220 family)